MRMKVNLPWVCLPHFWFYPVSRFQPDRRATVGKRKLGSCPKAPLRLPDPVAPVHANTHADAHAINTITLSDFYSPVSNQRHRKPIYVRRKIHQTREYSTDIQFIHSNQILCHCIKICLPFQSLLSETRSLVSSKKSVCDGRQMEIEKWLMQSDQLGLEILINCGKMIS